MKPSAMRFLPLLLLLALLLPAVPAAAQEADDDDVDYSRDTLMRIFVAEAPRDGERPPVVFHVGRVEFTTLGANWKFNYLPFMVPLSGTNPRVSREMPDPFALTGTQIATSPRAARQQRRARNAELRRIERTEKERAKIKVTTRSSNQ